MQCFIVTSSLFMFHFLFYLLFCPYLYITFAMLLCFGVCLLSITFVVEIFLFYAHMAPTPLHTRWDVRPYSRVYVSHKEWRLICGHAGSLTCWITVKPRLDFSSFWWFIVVDSPYHHNVLSKRMISLETSKVTWKYPWELSLEVDFWDPFH